MTITIDRSDLLNVDASLEAIRRGAPDAIRFATNDSLSALRTASSREIRRKVTARAAPVRDSLVIKRMYSTDMTANITCTGKPLPLVNFRHTVRMRGVAVQVKIPGSLKLIPHSFKATVVGGVGGPNEAEHVGIFWRARNVRSENPKWPVGRRQTLPSPDRWSPLWPYQLPINQLFGPRVPDVFKEDDVMNPILEEASTRYDNRLEYHTQRLLDRAAAA